MGKSGGGNTTTVQKSDPWVGVQGPLKELYGMTRSALSDIKPFYPEQTYAPLTPLQKAAMGYSLDYASNVTAPAAAGFQQYIANTMTAPGEIDQNPAVQAMMGANEWDVTDWLTRRALPAIQSDAISVGNLGSSRQGVAEGLAISEAAKRLANANAKTMIGAYAPTLAASTSAAGMLPTAVQMGLAPAEAMANVGGIEQAMQQKAIDEAIARYHYPETTLWDRLGKAAAIYSGAPVDTIATSSGPGGSKAAGILGGALTGAGLAGFLSSPAGVGLFGGTPTLAPLAAAGGPATLALYALGGAALGGLLS